MFDAIFRAVALLARTVFQGGGKAAEKAIGLAKVYIKGLFWLAILFIFFPIPFLIAGIMTGERWLVAVAGLIWFICALLVFAASTPLGILLESIREGARGSALRYEKTFVGIFSTGLYVSMLFSIIPIAANLSFFPLLIIVLLVLGLYGGVIFSKRFIVTVATIIFVFLMFTFFLPAQHQSLVNKIDFLSRPKMIDLTLEKVSAPDFAFFRSDGDNIYWYALTPDGRYEVFDRKGRHPKTNVDLLPLGRETVKRLIEQLKSENERSDKEKKQEEERRAREVASLAEAQKKNALGPVIDRMAGQIAQKAAARRHTDMAVIFFPQLTSGQISAFGVDIQDRLTQFFINKSKVRVFDIARVSEVTGEPDAVDLTNLSFSQITKLKEAAGVSSLLRGRVNDMGDEVIINWNLTETSTGNVYAAATESIRKDPAIIAALNRPAQISYPVFPAQEEPHEPPAELPKLPDPTGGGLRSTGGAERPSPKPPPTIDLASGPRVLDFSDLSIRIDANLVSPSHWTAQFDRTARPSGYHLFQINRAVIQPNSITFSLTWTNFTSSTARLLIYRVKSGQYERPFIRDLRGMKVLCTSFEPYASKEIFLKPRIPVEGTITFPNFLESIPANSTVDLYIQLWDAQKRHPYVQFRSIDLFN